MTPEELRRRRVAARGNGGDGRELWIHEVDRAIAQRLTSDGKSPSFPSWSPDGDLLAYANRVEGDRQLLLQPIDGSGGAESPLPFGVASDWSPNGHFLVYSRFIDGFNLDLWLLDRRANNGEGEPKPFLATEYRESGPQISPDGGFVAYCLDESVQLELYVRDFPSGANRRQVSDNGGCQARWSQDGKELFYVEGETRMSVEIIPGPEFRVGLIERLFSDPSLTGAISTYDVAADGRFVMVGDAEEGIEPNRKPAIRITENWYEEFRDRE